MGTRVTIALTVLACLAGATAVTGCAEDAARPAADDGLSAAQVERLSDVAQQVGAALDIAGNPPGSVFPPRRLTAALLGRSGVTLPVGTRVARYERATRPDGGRFRELAAADDDWQFCVVDDDGLWLTYGEVSGVQDVGTGGPTGCSFTGRHRSEAPADVRRAAILNAEVTSTEAFSEQADGSAGDGEAIRRLVVAELPRDWRVSTVDVRGIAYQYCVTTPDAGWFRIRVGAVTAYGDSGSCHLDPDMEPEF